MAAALTLRLRSYAIAEASMRPTLDDGDWILARREPRRVRPGDVVILDHPRQDGFELVKRVHSIDEEGITVLGDDPTSGSVDSVTFGPVGEDAITARVLLRYKPLPPRLVR